MTPDPIDIIARAIDEEAYDDTAWHSDRLTPAGNEYLAAMQSQRQVEALRRARIISEALARGGVGFVVTHGTVGGGGSK